jgi:hypothetical protein
MSELPVSFLVYSRLNSNIDRTLILSIDIAIKPSTLDAKYKKAKVMLCFLKIGNKIVAITTDVIPLKNKSNVEIMISFEFAEVVVRKSSENSTGPCKN